MKTGATALHLAVEMNLPEMIDRLAAAGADGLFLIEHSLPKSLRLFSLVLKMKIRNQLFAVAVNLTYGMLHSCTALHFAIEKVRVECVRHLLACNGTHTRRIPSAGTNMFSPLFSIHQFQVSF